MVNYFEFQQLYSQWQELKKYGVFAGFNCDQLSLSDSYQIIIWLHKTNYVNSSYTSRLKLFTALPSWKFLMRLVVGLIMALIKVAKVCRWSTESNRCFQFKISFRFIVSLHYQMCHFDNWKIQSKYFLLSCNEVRRLLK